MSDMDHTLIESIFKGDPRYDKIDGQLIRLDDDDLFKIHIRPGAIEMVRTIISSGHRYIVWSAGTRDYVHAAMKHFSKQAGVYPEKIYTREDMVPVETLEESVFGNKFKSNNSKGIERENLLIIEDDPSLVDPHERHRVILVERWLAEHRDDQEMQSVIKVLKMYGRYTPLIDVEPHSSHPKVVVSRSINRMSPLRPSRRTRIYV